jgi:large subunit ribosomal protein L23
MKHPSDILVRPLITEKGTGMQRILNQYIFEVTPVSTKIDIASAVKAVYGVDVVKVRIMWVKPKPKRVGAQRRPGHTRSWKKAIVSVAPGQLIGDFAV